jgi:hypothetical protein
VSGAREQDVDARAHLPCWDDKYNIEGGCLSMKVSHGDAADVVSELMRRALERCWAARRRGRGRR